MGGEKTTWAGQPVVLVGQTDPREQYALAWLEDGPVSIELVDEIATAVTELLTDVARQAPVEAMTP